MFIYKSQPFAPEAQRLWDEISDQAKQKILANVWCINCLKGVAMINISGISEDECLILLGNCGICGQPVVRVHEGE